MNFECLICYREIEKGKMCNTCRSRINHANNPVTRIFHNIKNRAGQRNRPFTMSLQWFKEFIQGTEYLSKKGRGADEYGLDCIIEELGYAEGNLQLLTNADNVKKRWEYQRNWGVAGLERQEDDIF